MYLKITNQVKLRTTSLPSLERIIQLISWRLNVPASQIFPYTHLKDDLHLDAFDRMVLIAELENRFGVYLSVEEAESIETVKDAGYFFLECAA